MSARTGPIVLALATLALQPASAQAPSPRDASARFLTSIGAGRYEEAAQVLDLTAFAEYVNLFITRSQQGPGDRRLPTVDDLRRQNPTMPREVAEWQLRQMREAQARFGDPTSYEFARVRSVADLRRLRTAEAAARWLEARDPRVALERQLTEMNCPLPSASDFPTPNRRLVGTVADGDSVVYAVYREEIQFGGPPSGGDIGVLELRLRAGRWLIQPRGDLLPEVSLGLEPGECPRGGAR